MPLVPRASVAPIGPPFAGSLRAAMGGMTEYERHRDRYVATGDMVSFRFMLGEVRLPAGTGCTGPHMCRNYKIGGGYGEPFRVRYCRESCTMCSWGEVAPCWAEHP